MKDRLLAGGVVGIGLWGWAGCSPPRDASAVEDAGVLAQSGPVRIRRLAASEVDGRVEIARGRPGDLVLENDQAQFVLSGGDGSNDSVGLPGGVLDAFSKAGGRRVPIDALDELWPLVNGAPIGGDLQAIELDPTSHLLELRIEGAQMKVPVMLDLDNAPPEILPLDCALAYRLGAGSSVLEIETRVVSRDAEPVRVELGEIATFATDETDMFTLPDGFDLNVSTNAPRALGAAMRDGSWAGLVFAAEPLQLVHDKSVRQLLGSGATGVIRYDVKRAELAPNEELRATHWLALGRTVADTTRALHLQRVEPTQLVSGRVLAGGQALEGARVSIFTDEALRTLETQARTDAQGAFRVSLPPGSYFARASGRGIGEHVEERAAKTDRSDGLENALVQRLEVPAEGATSPLAFSLAAPGQIMLRVLGADARPVAAKVVFLRDTPLSEPWRPAGERQPYRERGVAQVYWTLDGSIPASLPQGTYTLLASRGPRYGVARADGVVVTAAGSTLVLTLPERVGPGGYVAIDSHLHGADSGHGDVTRDERLITARAEGLDVAMAADHDMIIDYAPVARQLGIDGQLLTVPSVELTYGSAGHHGLWPLHARPELPLEGGARWWLNDPGLDGLYAYYRSLGARVIQLNHAGSVFAKMGYDPSTGRVRSDARFSFAFNALELYNAGSADGGRSALVPIWFSLLNWGHRVAPLGASDSHARIPEAGRARSYVWLGGAAATPESVADAVVALRSEASTGPLIELTLPDGTAALGHDVRLGPSDELKLALRVWAPEWVPIETVRLIANGDVIETWNASSSPAVKRPGADGLWFETSLELHPGRDTWYAVEAEGSADLSPIYPGLRPWAMTAPVFVDGDRVPGFTPRCQTGPCP